MELPAVFLFLFLTSQEKYKSVRFQELMFKGK